MKNFLLISFLICTLPVFSQSFNRESGGNRIEALKIAFLTKKLNLSPAEAQNFWPIYNQYSAEMRQARIAQRTNVASELQTEERILNIRKKYSVEFKKAISQDKIDTLFRAEKDFGNYVQKELSERRERRQQLNRNRDEK
jgi:hypothetical protein